MSLINQRNRTNRINQVLHGMLEYQIMILDVTELEVYQKSLDLLPRLYRLLASLPETEKRLKFQAKDAAQSIAPNIAEGFAKRIYGREFVRYLLIALGSSDEVLAHLRTIIVILPELTVESNELVNEYKILSKRINKLQHVWKSDHQTRLT